MSGRKHFCRAKYSVNKCLGIANGGIEGRKGLNYTVCYSVNIWPQDSGPHQVNHSPTRLCLTYCAPTSYLFGMVAPKVSGSLDYIKWTVVYRKYRIFQCYLSLLPLYKPSKSIKKPQLPSSKSRTNCTRTRNTLTTPRTISSYNKKSHTQHAILTLHIPQVSVFQTDVLARKNCIVTVQWAGIFSAWIGPMSRK